MKRFFGFLGAAMISVTAALSVNAGNPILLNEIEADPPVDVGDRCQYVELRGTPNSTIPSGFWFISINSDASNFGFLNAAVALEGAQFGTNGTLVLDNTNGGDCPNRPFDPASNVITYFNALTLGQGSEGFYVVNTNVMLLAGTDLDTNDNGVVDINDPLTFAGKSNGKVPAGGSKANTTGDSFSFVDGINFIFNPDEQFIYGPGPNLVEALLGDVPDAATRLPGNTDVNSAAAWYSGELASAPEETIAYAAPLSSNFPVGGMLTPGSTNVPAAPTGPVLFDYDGDGKSDISIFRPSSSSFLPDRGPEGSTSQWWILRSSNLSTRAAAFGEPTDIPVPADYTGDGRTDVAFFRPSSNEWFVLRSEDQSFFSFQFGATGDIPAPGDFDGDGIADPTVFRPNGGTWFTVQSSNQQTIIRGFGAFGDRPTVADFDGDGVDDLAIFRPNVSQWWQLRSTAGVIAYQFGQTGDRTAVGDYTGDGKADVAFFRPSNGTWFVLRSEDSSFFAFPWGVNGDIPVPADYDGDGKADPAVFRPSDRTWYLLRSTSGFQAVQFGVSGDVPTPSVYSSTAN